MEAKGNGGDDREGGAGALPWVNTFSILADEFTFALIGIVLVLGWNRIGSLIDRLESYWFLIGIVLVLCLIDLNRIGP
jgi:hypothetical protein